MKQVLGFSLALCLLFLGVQPAVGSAAVQSPELDAFWSDLSRTVAEGDFQGYASTYHPDAILVSGPSGTSYPISEALDGWKQGFTDTKAGKVESGVEFRFTKRLSDGATAHETGMFHYWVVDADGRRTDQFVHFEALLIKKEGWKMMMEYQKTPGTPEEWEAAG